MILNRDMIEITKAFKASDGRVYDSIEGAQVGEIFAMDIPTTTSSDVARWIVANSCKIVDILTMKPSSRPKARKVNGGKKTRKAAVELPLNENKETKAA